MFHSARLRLTFYYLIILTVITLLFSTAFYHSSTRQIHQLIHRLQVREAQFSGPNRPPLPPNAPSLEELQNLRHRSLITLAIINSLILTSAGIAAYILAGRTLAPIQTMLIQQNDFITNASHQLRTPLANLRAELETTLLEKKITPSQTKKLIKSNLEEVITLQNLTNQLLTLTQSPSTSRQIISLKSLVSSAQKQVSQIAHQKQITISTKIPKTKLIADRHTLTQALVIIFDNAIKFSPPKSTITVSATNFTNSIKLRIKDQGIGISSQDLPHIFDRFYRTDFSRSSTNGFGLGLSIANHIITHHQGKISAQSQLKKGTTITITLPKN